MSNELKPCPFCGSTDIRYSEKTATLNWECHYRLSYYCNKCHCYGPRFLTPPKEYYGEITEEERAKAKELWNKRDGASEDVKD